MDAAEALTKAQNLDALLLDAYEDPIERANIRAELLDKAGIDVTTGLPAEDPPDDPNPAGDDKPNGTEAEIAAALAPEGGGTKPEMGKSPEEQQADADAAAELEAVKAQLLERDRTIAELTARTRLADAEEQIQREADAAVAAKRAEMDAAAAKDKDAEARIREEFGDEIANRFADASREKQTLREENLESARQAEANKLRAVHAQHVASTTTAEQDLMQVPQLATWLRAANSGDVKAIASYKMALQIDEMMNSEPEWAGKTRLERYQEIGRRAAIMAGAEPPAPAPSDPPDPGKKGARTAKEIDAEIARQAGVTQPGPGKTTTLPDSLTDLPSGDVASGIDAALEQMDATDLYAKGLSLDALDKLIESRIDPYPAEWRGRQTH